MICYHFATLGSKRWLHLTGKILALLQNFHPGPRSVTIFAKQTFPVNNSVLHYERKLETLL